MSAFYSGATTGYPGLVLPLLFLALNACATSKLLRVENQLLAKENIELRDKLMECSQAPPTEDYLTRVDIDAIGAWAERAGFTELERPSPNVISIGVQGTHHTFHLNLQLFEREKVLFMVATDYLQLEEATSAQAMVLLLTQLAALNYDLLIGKFQLNPASGDITLSAEIHLDDGVGFQTFTSVLHHLIQTADDQHPILVKSARGLGM